MVMEQMCQQLLSKEVRTFIDSRNPMLTGSESNVGRNGRYEVRKSYYPKFRGTALARLCPVDLPYQCFDVPDGTLPYFSCILDRTRFEFPDPE